MSDMLIVSGTLLSMVGFLTVILTIHRNIQPYNLRHALYTCGCMAQMFGLTQISAGAIMNGHVIGGGILGFAALIAMGLTVSSLLFPPRFHS